MPLFGMLFFLWEGQALGFVVQMVVLVAVGVVGLVSFSE